MAARTRRKRRRRFRRNFFKWGMAGMTTPARRPRRRHRRGGWFNDRPGHRTAGRIGAAYSARRKKGGLPRRYIRSSIGVRGLYRYRALHKPARRRRHAGLAFRYRARGKSYRLVANARRGRRRYMDNQPVAKALSYVTGVFDPTFLTNVALPVTGGFFASRMVSGVLGQAVMGTGYTGIVRHIGNLVSSGLAGAAAGILTKNPSIAGNVLLGGVLNAVSGIIRDIVKNVEVVKASPELSMAFGLSGMDDMRDDIEREVMQNMGVSDYLSAEQLSRAERIGDYLSAEQLSRAERVGQYPAETSGALAQYPSETSGYAMSDIADIGSLN